MYKYSLTMNAVDDVCARLCSSYSISSELQVAIVLRNEPQQLY